MEAVMDNERADEREGHRLPGFDRPAVHRRPDHAWYGENDGPPARYAPESYVRQRGVRNMRRASTWTTAALIAAVAATTGYLAHAIPASSSAGTSTSAGTSHTGNSSAVRHGAPSVGGPVVTSGGSGVTAGSAGGGDR
jgi:hypothetical protein